MAIHYNAGWQVPNRQYFKKRRELIRQTRNIQRGYIKIIKCRYCGVVTSQPEAECYKNPSNR